MGGKDEPSHQQVHWSKFKPSYLRVGGQTNHSQVPWYKI